MDVIKIKDWYDGYIEDGRMNVYLISDTHFNHANIATYCDRPADFTEVIIKRWQETVKPQDLVIHLGDVFIGNVDGWDQVRGRLTGRRILVRGNHDRNKSNSWWMEHGFDFACDGMRFRGQWLSHEPENSRPGGVTYNIHGHLHNIWHGFAPNAGEEEIATKLGHLKNPWQRLFAVEYTDYRPVEFDKFVSHPDKYQSRGSK